MIGVEWAFLAERVLPALNQGLTMSVALIVPAAAIGFFFGMALGVARVFGPPWLRGLGENPQVRAMFVKHLHQALNETLGEAA